MEIYLEYQMIEESGADEGCEGRKCLDENLFRQDVKEALKNICPSATLTTRDNSAGVSTDFVDMDWDSLCISNYCAHRAGCNLLIELLELDVAAPSADSLIIRPSQNEDRYIPGSYGDIPVVEWMPPYIWGRCGCNTTPQPPSVDCTPSKCEGCNNGPRDSSGNLAHELIHAWHDHMRSSFVNSLGNETWEEVCTIQAQNQILSEMNKPKRCRYFFTSPCIEFPKPHTEGKWKEEMPDGEVYTCHLLGPNEDKKGCSCGPNPRKWWEVLAAWLICLVRKVLPTSSWPGFSLPDRPGRWQESGFEGEFQSFFKLPEQESEFQEMQVLAAWLVEARAGFVGPLLDEMFRQSSQAVVHERLSISQGYFLSAFFTGAHGSFLLTNRYQRPTRAGPGWQPTPQDRFRLYALNQDESNPIQSLIQNTLTADDGPTGIGGSLLIADGDADFLRLKSNRSNWLMAARNLSYTANHPSPKRPKDVNEADQARWKILTSFTERFSGALSGIHREGRDRVELRTLRRSTRSP